MQVFIHPTADAANAAAADQLAGWLTTPGVRTVMVAAGNTPLDLYRRIGERGLDLGHLTVFALDEYVGVPLEEPRNCANLLRRTVAEAWRLPAERFHAVSSRPEDALSSVQRHEQLIAEAGGLDVLILGLGQNGHLGFNEPGSDATSPARVLDLESISIEANRQWFRGVWAPAHGVTVGMPTVLGARRIQILAYGKHKTAAVAAMLHGPRSPACPASYLQTHPAVSVFLDPAAAGQSPPP